MSNHDEKPTAFRPVRIYTTSWCPYCHEALAILKQHKIPFKEIAVDSDPEERIRLRKVTGQRTVPQIFFGDESIGGCSELQGIVRSGQLNNRLAA